MEEDTLKATREWFYQEAARYGTSMEDFSVPFGEDPSGNEWYPWANQVPPVLPGQVWALCGHGAVLALAVDGPRAHVEWGGTHGSGTTPMPDVTAGEACLVYGPRAPWCPLRVWLEEEKKTWPPN